MRIFSALILSLVSVLMFSSATAHHKDTFEYVKQVPPIMPPQAYQSGYCCMSYDIDRFGRTKRIQVSYCTENYLAAPSKAALSEWIYGTKKKDGTNVKSENLTTYMSFRLTNHLGVVIPGQHGFMTKKPDGSYNMDKTCGLLIS